MFSDIIDRQDAERQAEEFLIGLGLIGPFIFDGKIHRCSVEGKPESNKDGAYQIHLDEWPSGGGQNWHTSTGWIKWKYEPKDRPSWTPSQKREYARVMEAKEEERRQQEEEEHVTALTEAKTLYDTAMSANPEHSYFAAKGITELYGDIRQHKETLLIPMCDVGDRRRQLRGLQRIFRDTETGKHIKAYYGGIKISKFPAAAFCIDDEGSESRCVCVCEGAATGMTAAAALDMAKIGYRGIYAAGGEGRLEGVCRAARAVYPSYRIIILSDDDHKADGRNPGFDRARSLVNKGLADGICLPPFDRSDDADSKSPSDWNDFAALHGLDATAAELQKQLEAMNVPVMPEGMPSDPEDADEADEEKKCRLLLMDELERRRAKSGRAQIVEKGYFQLREKVRMIYDAMLETNAAAVQAGGSPHFYFDASAKAPVCIRISKDRRVEVKPISAITLSHIADFWTVRGTRKFSFRHTDPSPDLMKHLENASGEMERLPTYKGISTTPIIRQDGTIFTAGGYDEDTGFYYDKRAEISIPEIPTQQDAREAMLAIHNEVFADFPFENKRDEANAFAALATAVLRKHDMFRNTPLFHVNAPCPGIGKTLLAQSIKLISDRRDDVTEFPAEDEELRKKVTSYGMAGGIGTVIFDNVSEKIVVEHQTLALMLTSGRTIQDRELGKNRIIEFSNKMALISTGNNTRFSRDIARRVVFIKLNDFGRPKKTKETANNPDRWGKLLEWLEDDENNAKITGMLLTAYKAYVLSGSPIWSRRPVPSFEAWSRVIGGFLEFADHPTLGLSYFMGDAEDIERAISSDDRAEWGAFFEAIYSWNPSFTLKQLAEKCRGYDTYGIQDALPDSFGILSDGDRNDGRIFGALRRELPRRVDNVFDGERGRYMLRRTRDGHTKVYVWRIDMLDEDGNRIAPTAIDKDEWEDYQA